MEKAREIEALYLVVRDVIEHLEDLVPLAAPNTLVTDRLQVVIAALKRISKHKDED